MVNRVPVSCPRLLLNLESVGEVEPARTRFAATSYAEGFDFEGVTSRKEGIRDVRFLGTSDEGVRQLAKALGWAEELEATIKREHALLSQKEDQTNSTEEEAVSPEEKQEEVIEAVTEIVKGETVEEEIAQEETQVDDLSAAVEQVKLDEKTEAPRSPPKATL